MNARHFNALGAVVGFAVTAAVALAPADAAAQASGKVKIGLMLPYTGTYAALGTAITNGLKLAID